MCLYFLPSNLMAAFFMLALATSVRRKQKKKGKKRVLDERREQREGKTLMKERVHCIERDARGA